jgi:sigma-B regulation protein RsbU (phosphoserine phosphatase)
MKFPHITSIQLSIALWASACLLVSGIVIVTYTATAARMTAINSAEERAVAEARIQAGIVKAEIEVGLDTARARAQELSAVKRLKNPLIISREQVNAMMRQVLVENPQYIGVWTLWEPNAFDGQDARYANTKAYGVTGRYFPYWNRGSGEITVEPIVDFDTGDWYQEPKRNKQEYVTDLYTYPVMGLDVPMISVVAPIVVNGTFYGVAGEDIPVTFLQELADKVNIYNGAGKLLLIGNNGKLVAATGQPEMRGKPPSELINMQVSEEYLEVLQTGKERIELTQDHVEAIVPIHFGRTVKPWAAMVILPSDVIVTPANELMWRLVVIALVMMLAGVGALWLVARQITRPIRQVTAVALQVASGDLTKTIELGERHDELGLLAKGFNYMTQQLRSLYGTLEQRLDEVKQASQSLRESEERFRALVETSSDWIWEVNEEGVLTYASPKLNDLLGYTPVEVMGKYLFDMMPPEEAARIRKQFSEVAQSCRPIVNLEATNRHKKGGSVILEISGVPVFDRTGVFHGYRGVARDITDRKRAEEALREAAIKYRIVADHTYNWEFLLSPQERFIYSSPSCHRITGHTPEEFSAIPDLIRSIIHPDDLHLWTGHRHNIIQTKVLGDIEFRIVRTDGDARWIHHVCMPVFDDNGNFLGTRGSCSDITKRKEAEEKNLRLAAIVESSDDAIVGKTIDGIITSWNRGAEKIFDYKEGEVLGKPITMLIPTEYVDDVLKMHERIRHGEHIEHFETVRRRKDGELIYMSLTYSPIRDAQGRVIAVSTIGRDITAQKKAAAALLENARINRELEIAQEIQQSFLPVCPSALPGMLMTCRCVPAAHVGGDYYDFFSLEAGIVDAVIADVTGHNVGSSLLMTMTRSVLHAMVSASCLPGKLLAAVNDLIHQDLTRAELQISMSYVRLDTVKHTLAYANAGHNPPLLFRSREGAFMQLDADGLLMGVKTDVSYEEKITRVEAGDILILYTDGITEAEDVDGSFFGTSRLCTVIAEHCEGHPKEIMAAIFQELAPFTISDDMAMIIFKII